MKIIVCFFLVLGFGDSSSAFVFSRFEKNSSSVNFFDDEDFVIEEYEEPDFESSLLAVGADAHREGEVLADQRLDVAHDLIDRRAQGRDVEDALLP